MIFVRAFVFTYIAAVAICSEWWW